MDKHELQTVTQLLRNSSDAMDKHELRAVAQLLQNSSYIINIIHKIQTKSKIVLNNQNFFAEYAECKSFFSSCTVC